MVASDLQAALVCHFLDRGFSIHASTDCQVFCTLRHGTGRTQERIIVQHGGSVILQGDWQRTAARLVWLIEASPADTELFDGFREVRV